MNVTVLSRSFPQAAEQQRCAQIHAAAVESSLGEISLVCTSDFEVVRQVWEALQTNVPCAYAQTFHWARAWARHVLAAEESSPAIIAGYDSEGEALFLWPFEVARFAGIPVLRWLGQAHANYNLGLFRNGIAERLKAEDLARLLGAVAERTGAAAALFQSQPFSWEGVRNPFATLPAQPSPNSGFALRLGDFETIFHERFGAKSRSQLARKERKLASLGPLAYGWAEPRQERLALLDVFFAQKAKQFAEMGVTDPLTPPHKAFYREMALLEGANPSRLRLGYLKVGDEIAATFNMAVTGRRAYVCLSSLASEAELQRQSPGALLLRHQIEEACEQGLTAYDFGVGAARHKEQWSDIIEPLFDSFLAFRPQGELIARPLAAATRLKRAIKTSPYLWPLAQRLRRRLRGVGSVD